MTKIICPSCGFSRSWAVRRNRRKCKRCRKEFGLKLYPISGFRATEEEWLRCIGTFLRERTISRVREDVGRSHGLAERMVARLRRDMSGDPLPRMEGPVEIDETYVGGQRKNKCLHIRRIKGKRGHGTDKLPIVGFFDRPTGSVAVFVEPKKLDIAFIIGTLGERADPGAAVYSDGFKMYRKISDYGFLHEWVDHAGGEYVRGDVHTNNIEGFWGILKRKMGCIGGMRRKYLYLFVGEIAWKFNHGRMSHEKQKRALWELVLRS
jgi:transposase-like protein